MSVSRSTYAYPLAALMLLGGILLSQAASAPAGAAVRGVLGAQSEPPNTWVPTGSMAVARSGQTATLLRDDCLLYTSRCV